jgi:hypothetical protein
MTRFWSHALAVSLVILRLSTFAGGASPADTRLFDCSVFPADLTAAQLTARFGREHVVEGPVYIGEGESATGTILFPDSDDSKVEMVWQNAANRSDPQFVLVRTKTSRWRSPTGLRLGLTLRQVERLNRRPFSLLGFDWDYGGTQTTWKGGAIGRGFTPGCELRARFTVLATHDRRRPSIDREITGDRELSSGHAAIQSLNPVIDQLFLQYER